MDINLKKKWMFSLLIAVLSGLIIFQFYTIHQANRRIEAYEANSISAYRYILTLTDFESFAEDIEELSQTEEFDDETYYQALALLDSTTTHLMQLNALKGYSVNDDRLSFRNDALYTVANYSYKYTYVEQIEYHELIRDVWFGFFELLREMRSEGITDGHREALASLSLDIREVEDHLQFIVDREYLDPQDFRPMIRQFQKVNESLEGMRDTLSVYDI